jgi:SAM-dependent methyltransferase
VAAQLRDVLGVRGELRVLDVGCGQGTQVLALARAGHRLTGLDPAPRLLQEFAAALAREPVDVQERVQLVEGTMGIPRASAVLTSIHRRTSCPMSGAPESRRRHALLAIDLL